MKEIGILCESHPYLTSNTKTNFREIKELNTKDKNLELLEIKTEEFFTNTGSENFFQKTPKSDRKKRDT